MKKTLFLLNLMFWITLSFAQDTTYEPLTNRGSLPEDLTRSAFDKYLELKQADESQEGDVFKLESTYLLDNILRSGYVLFNDPIGDYVNQVLAEVLNSNPELNKDSRIYILKSPEVNAFAVDQGIFLLHSACCHS